MPKKKSVVCGYTCALFSHPTSLVQSIFLLSNYHMYGTLRYIKMPGRLPHSGIILYNVVRKLDCTLLYVAFQTSTSNMQYLVIYMHIGGSVLQY